MRFAIALAGYTVEVEVQHTYTRSICDAYLVDGEPDFAVAITQENIESERALSVREDERAGRPLRSFSDGYLESIAVHRAIAAQMLERGVLLFHGSTIAVDGLAYLFTAPSGTGKSTHSNLWAQVLGDRLEYVNDDKPLLRFTEWGVEACGTPWCGSEQRGSNIVRPLARVVLLERDETDWVSDPLPPSEAFPRLYVQAYRPSSEEGLAKSMQLTARLAELVPVVRMGCTPRLHAARVAIEALGVSRFSASLFPEI